MSWLNDCRIFFQRVPLEDYPEYAACPVSPEYPGAIIGEHFGLAGARWCTAAGYAATAAYFYGVRRPRLSFADRATVKLHHYLFPSAGYTVPVGVVSGIAYGALREGKRVEPAAVAAALHREEVEARAAQQQHEKRARLVEMALRARQSTWSRIAVALRIQPDPVKAKMKQLGLIEPRTWESFATKGGRVHVELHSCVHDRRWYKDYTGPIVTESTSTRTSGSRRSAASSSATTTSITTTTTTSPPAVARFTKPQVDALVSDALLLRSSPAEERWSRTAGRLSGIGTIAMILFWNSQRSLFCRVNMGIGAGLMAGAAISATGVDEALQRL